MFGFSSERSAQTNLWSALFGADAPTRAGSIAYLRASDEPGGRLSAQALKALLRADVILYGRHVDPAVLACAVGDGRLVYLNGAQSAKAQDIAADAASRGRNVVYLLGTGETAPVGATVLG
jgi:hypothetical protein